MIRRFLLQGLVMIGVRKSTGLQVGCRSSEHRCRTMGSASRLVAVFNAERPVHHGNAKLATPWYLAERCQDERDRADDASYVVLIVQPAQVSSVDETHIVETLLAGLRRADVVAEIGVRRYAVLLAGAGRYDAGRAASRIRVSLPGVEIGIAAYPQDGANLGELVSLALETLRAS